MLRFFRTDCSGGELVACATKLLRCRGGAEVIFQLIVQVQDESRYKAA